MKIFPILLAAALFTPGAAFASRGGRSPVDTDNDGRGASCERGNASFCGGGQGGQGGEGGDGGDGGQGGQGGQGGDGGNSDQDQRQRQRQEASSTSDSSSASSASSGSSSGSSSNSNQTQSANNSGNNQSINIRARDRHVPIAPLPVTDSVGQIGDIKVPLPNIGVGTFTSTQPNQELDYGVSVGVRVPLGAGRFHEAARVAAERREQRALFTLVSEAVALRNAGVLDPELHPEHWAAINK